MSAVLSASHLTKTFGTLKAVDDLSLEIEPGTCFALLGPNGAGKTTTVEMLEGLTHPDQGEITIFGKNLFTQREEILERTGVLLQETRLYKKATVLETLQLFGSFFQRSRDPFEIIDILGLNDKADTRLENLSGGQKQRAYLGCSLINYPDLLFLDEPTTGLDPQARRMIWDLLERLKREGASIVLTTHYMDEAEQLADEVAIVDQGKIIAQNTSKQLIREICGEQVLSFSFADSGESLKQNIASRLPWFAGAKISGDGFEVVTLEATKHITELVNLSDELDMPLANLQMRPCTLEDVFLKLTGRSMRDD